MLQDGWHGARRGAISYKKEPREVGGRFFPLSTPVFLPVTPPPATLRGSRRGFLRSAPMSCLLRQLGLAGAVPDTHPPCWKGVNRSGCRQGSRERAGLGLHPTTARSCRGVGSAEAGGRDGGGRPGGGVPAGSWARPWFREGMGMLPLPQFTSGAKVGLLFRGLEVLMCCPATPFPVPVWEAADQSSPWTGGP